MAGSGATRLDLTHIIARYPGDGTLIRRLLLKDETFRGVCEEYLLARASLSWFEANAASRPEVVEFRSLVPSLESEIEVLLRQARSSEA